MKRQEKGQGMHLRRTKVKEPEIVNQKSEPAEPMRRVHLSYAGQVNDGQFIYTATETAEKLGLTGWISRAYHGIADLVVQGPASKVKSYEKTMVDNESAGVLYSLADLEELKPVVDEQGFQSKNVASV